MTPATRHRRPWAAIVCLAFPAALALGCKKEPPDISDTKAEGIAEVKMSEFCEGGDTGGKCTDFFPKGKVPATDPRFHWGFRWVSEFTTPQKEIFVQVGKKGDSSVEIRFLSAEETAAAPAPGAPAPAAPAEGPK